MDFFDVVFVIDCGIYLFLLGYVWCYIFCIKNWNNCVMLKLVINDCNLDIVLWLVVWYINRCFFW